MSTTIKSILPYIKQAETLESYDPRISFFCKMYAVQLGISIMRSLPDGDEKTEFTTKMVYLMNQLEDYKTKNGGGDDSENCRYATEFATKVFDIADSDDRTGKITKDTALSFFSSVTLFEILKQFYPDQELPNEILEKQKYAKYKAAYISKCLKSGTVPQPGPTQDQPYPSAPAFPSDQRMLDNTPTDQPMFDSNPNFQNDSFVFPDAPSAPPQINQQQQQQQPPNQTNVVPIQQYQFNQNGHSNGHSKSNMMHEPVVNFAKSSPSNNQRHRSPSSEDEKKEEDMIQALRHARFIVSSLQFEDTQSALQNARVVYEILRQYEESM